MSLFQCENCGCCENTAPSHQGCSLVDCYNWTGIEDRKGKKLCSVCGPTEYSDGGATGLGIWHNLFPRTFLEKGQFKTNREGNLEHIETGRTDFRAFAIVPPAAGRELLSASKPAAPAQSREPVAYVSPNGATRIVLLNGARLNDDDELYAAPPSQHADGGETATTVKIYETYTGQNGWLEVTQEEYDRTKDKYEHRIRRVPAPSAMALDDERAAFEAALPKISPHRENGYDLTRSGPNLSGDDYYDEDIQTQWEVWQARAAIAQPVEQTRAPKTMAEVFDELEKIKTDPALLDQLKAAARPASGETE